MSSEVVSGEGLVPGRTLLGVAEHSQRYGLQNELHVGAVELLSAPVQISHLALLCHSGRADDERKLIAELCERFGVSPPTAQNSHFNAQLGMFKFNWERHTEYSTYTFFHAAPFDVPFAEPPIKLVPKDWLAKLPGEIIVAVNIAMEDRKRPRRTLEELAAVFASNTVIGAEVAAGSAVVWTDNQIHRDGFGRILIHDVDLKKRQAGRLVQRLLEIETYRMLAMLPVPLMRSYIPLLPTFDQRLAQLTGDNIRVGCIEDEQRQLNQLMGLAAEIESIFAKTHQRFNASSMYYEIVRLRISQLREKRIQGLQMFEEFMEQRLSSAMGTCKLVNQKLETLSTRVERASSLLRAQIEISMEKQSRDLLRSMDERARMQLRLQEAVEGLSIVVLSYYLLGLVTYGLKAIKASGFYLDVEVATGVAIPVVVGVVYMSVSRFRRRAHKRSTE
ncbi:MAG: DUF3422 domain-containing protein [Gammaproteobacteria bacterium]|nr:DUF3422 domain-containing protein [Gammaproteobacteria bacterium]